MISAVVIVGDTFTGGGRFLKFIPVKDVDFCGATGRWISETFSVGVVICIALWAKRCFVGMPLADTGLLATSTDLTPGFLGLGSVGVEVADLAVVCEDRAERAPADVDCDICKRGKVGFFFGLTEENPASG